MTRSGTQSSSAVSHMLRRVEQYAVLGALVFVGLFMAAALFGGGGEVVQRLAEVGPQVLLGMLLLSLINYACRAIRWQMFSLRLAVSPGWLLACLYYVAGFSMTATPAKLGEAMRLWLLKRGHGFPYERTISLLVADRLSDLAAIMVLCFIGIAAFGTYIWATVVGGGLTAGLIVLFLKPRIAIVLLSRLYAIVGRWPRLFVRLRKAARHAGSIASLPVCVAALVLSMIGWLAEVIAFHWLLGEFEAGVGLGQAIFIFSFSMIVGAMTMVPGGLVGTEASMAGMLIAIGVEPGIAIAATAIIRITTLWFAIALGFLILPHSLRSAEHNHRTVVAGEAG